MAPTLQGHVRANLLRLDKLRETGKSPRIALTVIALSHVVVTHLELREGNRLSPGFGGTRKQFKLSGGSRRR
jgi:hypothetical protein